ncbi:MAG: quinone-dependent dihydroorotate dehydrogenase [Terrimonas sp.]|nr:quinone-dependent dihydroorotate dehydrogenase [Terrimonas sp.]
MYTLLRRFLFLFDPEKVHYFSMNILKGICSMGWMRHLLARYFACRSQPVGIFNIRFKNAVGLGAGFDKNAKYLKELETLGFGFVEIGTVTPLAQAGNDQPRLFRLPKDKALINRMGFNNEGVQAVAERLKQWRHENHNTKLVVGGNIGKNKLTPNEEAWKDYEICFDSLHPYVDYFVVNVSSPNTPGLRALQEKASLRKILTHLQQANHDKDILKPILLKIAPDLSLEQIDDVIDLAQEIGLDGLVVSNTTISREGLCEASQNIAKEAGGLSGKPVQKKSTELLHYIADKTQGKLPLIASGGIFYPEDAREKMEAGASLVQVWTGFIYVGPAIVKKICKGLSSN